LQTKQGDNVMDRWRVRDCEIFFDGRLYGREIENLPAIFAMEARTDLELGARPARAAAMIEAAEVTGHKFDADNPDD
jgi:hypothetical protein